MAQEFYSQQLGRWTSFNEMLRRDAEVAAMELIKITLNNIQLKEYDRALKEHIDKDSTSIIIDYLEKCPKCNKFADEDWHEKNCEFYPIELSDSKSCVML